MFFLVYHTKHILSYFFTLTPFTHMHPQRIWYLCIIFLLLCPTTTLADISIAEFTISGGAGHTNDDFIELANTSGTPVALDGWRLCRRSRDNQGDCASSSNSIKSFGKNDIIPAHGTYLWANTTSMYVTLPPDSMTTDTLTENNSIALFNATKQLVDAVVFGSGHALPFKDTVPLENPAPKQSHTRDLITKLWNTNTPPTPTNSHGKVFTLPTPLPVPDPTDPPHTIDPSPLSPGTIRINELFPDPKAPDDMGEYIELYNTSATPVDISGWKLTDTTSTGKYIFPDTTSIGPHAYFVRDDTDFNFSLNNGTETISLFDTHGALIDATSYTKTAPDASLNYTESGWRLSQTRTPGSANILSNTLPITQERVPKKGYRDMYTDFYARGSDADGDTLKYVWDFGDGHKSYKGNTQHRYLKTGTYTVTLTTKDDTEETSETFVLKIEKFIPPKLRLIALFPNPSGKDTQPGAEWIEIENHSKKSVDLLGYSLATGTKKLVNHPIKTSFVIPKKSSRKLTRDFALFTLPNQKGKIELRAPNGKTIHSLKYKYAKSLADNTTLKKEKGKPLALITPPTIDTLQNEENSVPLADIPVKEVIQDTIPVINVSPDPPMTHSQDTSHLLTLTALGTDLSFSDTLLTTLVSPPPTDTRQLLLPNDHYAITFARSLSFRINTWLNHWLTHNA